jgi:hypothetical protein
MGLTKIGARKPKPLRTWEPTYVCRCASCEHFRAKTKPPPTPPPRPRLRLCQRPCPIASLTTLGQLRRLLSATAPASPR